MRKYHYLILFMIGFLVLWPFMLHKLYIEEKKNTEVFEEQIADTGEETPEETDISVPMPGSETASGSEAAAGSEAVPGSEAAAENGTAPDAEIVSGNEAAGNGTASGEEAAPEAAENGSGEAEAGPEDAGNDAEELPSELFFQDTLFIGDSRTMGLAEYADLNNAVVFANTGMNIYRLYSLKNAVREQDTYLEDILADRQYRKIYLMLGINELGYDETQTVKRFEEEVVKLRKLQPDAKIVLEANLHVTKARSERDAIFNNDGIDRMNESIRQIAEKYGLSYIDVNELFDDEDGGLNPEYTHDEVHVLGKYYQQWADWIRENGV